LGFFLKEGSVDDPAATLVPALRECGDKLICVLIEPFFVRVEALDLRDDALTAPLIF
jgi:hypothetical protein